MQTLEQAATFLDTRGHILGLLPWQTVGSDGVTMDQSDSGLMKMKEMDVGLAEEEDPFEDPGSRQRYRSSSYAQSLTDMNLAVEAVETWRLAMASPLYNSPEIPVSQLKQNQQDRQQTHAVLLYHRMLIHRREGNEEAAGADGKKILELGFVPDERLH